MPITDWPDDEKPREKLLRKGPETLSDAELLAIFLRTGVRGKTAVDLARELLNDFGSLRALLESDFERFSQSPGLGLAKYAQLQAVLEMARRHLKETLRREGALTSPAVTRQYLASRLRGYPHEVFGCLFLDNQHRVIEFDELFRGTIDGASVYPREVVKKALAFNAAAVIFAHSHPLTTKALLSVAFSAWRPEPYSQTYSLFVLLVPMLTHRSRSQPGPQALPARPWPGTRLRSRPPLARTCGHRTRSRTRASLAGHPVSRPGSGSAAASVQAVPAGGLPGA